MLKSIVDYLGVIERKFTRFSLTILLALLGAKAAGGYLIYSPIVRRTQARILWLHEQIRSRKGQDAADAFVFDYLSARPRVQDYSNLLVGTGGNRPSTDKVAESLPATMKTAATSADASVALVSTLLDRGDIELALKVITEHMNDARVNSSVNWPSLLLSLTPRPLFETKAPGCDLATVKELTPQPCKNRLIIMDEELSPSSIKNLAVGAEKITLLQYGDLYGRIDLNAVQAEIPDREINVEHGRSRVDRFHQRYFDIHQKTFGAAKALSESFVNNTQWISEFVPDLSGFTKDLTLDLSDQLFFKALRLEGVYRAARDPEFDSVIVSFGDNFELFRLFFSDTALWRDVRIRGCCQSRKIKTIRKFSSRISEMPRRATVGSVAPILGHISSLLEKMPIRAGSPSDDIRRYLNTSAAPAKYTSETHQAGRDTIAFVANDARAYVASTIQLATHLQSRFNVDIVLTQGKVGEFRKGIVAAQNDAYLSQSEKGHLPGLVKVGAAAPNTELTRAFSETFLLTVADTVREQFSACGQDVPLKAALDLSLTDGLARGVLQCIGNVRAISTHLNMQNYSAIAISPIRSARNAQFATLARAAGVPTVAVEPHLLNAAYCRYGTILTDYAALYSDHYVEEYERHFGIPKTRSYAFGSPRILRPIGYDPIASRKNARQRIGLHAGDPAVLAFPTQPMPADFILAVLRMIVRAVKAYDKPVRLLIKPHPEEGAGHVARYRQIIAEEKADDVCFVVDLDIKDLISASELVLAAYSVTALEAAVLERNVAIVGQNGAEYPTAYDKILGVPYCATMKETLEVIRDALEKGREAKSGASEFHQANPHLFENSTFLRLAEIIEEIVKKGPRGIRRPEDLPDSIFVTAPFREYLV